MDTIEINIQDNSLSLIIHDVPFLRLEHLDYFKNYNKYIWKENLENKITLVYTNAHIMHDVIMELIDRSPKYIPLYPQWYYQLEKAICYDYLLINFDLSLLANIEVPQAGFDLLLKVASMYQIDDVVIKNLPSHYSIELLPQCIIDKVSQWYIVTGDHDGKVKLWDPLEKKVIKEIQPYSKWIPSICLSDDKKAVFIGAINGSIKKWNYETDIPEKNLSDKYYYWVSSITTLLDNKIIAIIAGCKNEIQLWCMENSKSPIKIIKENTKINDIVTIDGETLAYGCDDGNIIIRNIYDSNPKTILKDHRGEILCLAYKDRLASGGIDRIIRMWVGKNIIKMKGHTRNITALSFSMDGEYLASGSEDKTIRIWDSKGVYLRSLIGHTGIITSICFISFRKIISSGMDRMLCVWNTEDNQSEVINNESGIHHAIAIHPYYSAGKNLGIF